MVDNLTNRMHRDLNITHSDANNVNTYYQLQAQPLTQKVSDHNNSNHHHHTHHQSVQSPPMITTTDYSDPSSLSVMRVSQSPFVRRNSDTGYDTDGGIGTNPSRLRLTSEKSHGYEHFVSPRLPPRRSVRQPSKLPAATTVKRHSSPNAHLGANLPAITVQHHEDKVEEPVHQGNTHRQHIRQSRHVHLQSHPRKNHESSPNHSSAIPRHDGVLATTISGRPFRLIFMRHSERINQVFGSSWFSRAFRTNTYQPFDPNLPSALPKRHSDQAYEFDSPLTANGLKGARNTGRAMISTSLVADVCLSSTALRCIQTADRVLTGMGRVDHVPIRVEPGLFECPHLNYKIIESFMTKNELLENGYKIKNEYRPLISKLNVPESLNEYFDRCVTVMRGIIDRYGHHGGTVLIMTHAPGLLALTEAIKGKRPDHDTFYRTVAKYPPLSLFVSEYDGTKWKHSDEPFSITPLAK